MGETASGNSARMERTLGIIPRGAVGLHPLITIAMAVASVFPPFFDATLATIYSGG
jgi:hypothetical protein